VILKYSDRPEKRVGEDSVWDKSEAALLEAIKQSKLEYTINKGEGAFYGPKIEFVLRDAIGRDWQCGTLQVDLNLPNRLGATFVDKDGTKKVPVMLHRALFGEIYRHTHRKLCWKITFLVVTNTSCSVSHSRGEQ
jgi:threonyl-tRNA synthetase